MDLQDNHDYYEANAADVSLEQITSSAANAKILQRLRDGDDKLTSLHLSTPRWGWIGLNSFIISEEDLGWLGYFISEEEDLGWLGYFIGKSEHLESLHIWSMHEGEQIDAFVKGIASNHSIRNISIGYMMSNDARAAIVRAVGNYSQLEKLSINCYNFGPNTNSHSALGTLLESGVCSLSLRELRLFGSSISGVAVGAVVNFFKCIGASLEVLELSGSSIGNEGLLALVAGLANTTTLKTLDLASNDLSLAAEGLRSLSEWLHSSPTILRHLNLSRCQINDQGLQAFAQGTAIHCRELVLKGNESITATGLSCLLKSLQSESCRVDFLDLLDVPSAIGNDGMKALARVLAHNTSLKSLRLGSSVNDDTVPPSQWLAFSNALCDTSSVNSTYRSNHTIHKIFCGRSDAIISRPEDIALYLRLNEQHPKYAARCKILMKHKNLGMRRFLQWDLKLLPVALTWFEQAKTCTTLNVQLPVAEADLEADAVAVVERRVVEESDKVFGSRVLSAMYEFVRGMPMQVMKSRNGLELTAAYDDKIAKIEEEHKLDLEQRDGMNAQLQEEIARLELENKRLREIVESVRKSVGV